jgi:hypothetical protein
VDAAVRNRLIANGQTGFVEYSPWRGEHSPDCRTLPFTEVTFYNPTSNTAGASRGKVANAFEYGNCVKKVAFKTAPVFGGISIKVGY